MKGGSSRPLILGLCKCGHTADAHSHLRRGTDCSVCNCKRFRKPGRWDWLALGVWIGLPLLSWIGIGIVIYGVVKFVQSL